MFRKANGNITYCAKTDRGLKRNVNQDAVAVFKKDNMGLFVVSDGMGGHSRGELASREVAMEFETFWNELLLQNVQPVFPDLVEQVYRIILRANQSIYQQYNQGQICGATVVVLLIVEDCYAVFSVGDSRIYSYAKRKFDILTVDDIWDNLPDTINYYTPEQIAMDGRSGQLSQAIGTNSDINVHISTDRVVPKQVFLLCSDGLFKYCEEDFIKKGMHKSKSENSMQKVAEDYLQKVYDNDAGDNVSFVLVRVE